MHNTNWGVGASFQTFLWGAEQRRSGERSEPNRLGVQEGAVSPPEKNVYFKLFYVLFEAT